MPAVLPHGPPRKWEYDDAEVANLSLNQKYNVLSTRLEEEVAGLKPMSDKEKAAMSGRAEGPKFAMRCPMGNDTRAPRKTTATSRAWRRTSGWLDDLATSENVAVQAAARRRILTYPHPKPHKYKATPEQLNAFAAFEKVEWDHHERTLSS